MTNRKLEVWADDELVGSFEIWAKAHGQAVINGDVPAANRTYRKLDAVDKELRSRGLSARRQMLRLLDHPELPVRYYAAKKLLALEPLRARSIIEDVATCPFVPLAGAAGMTLHALDQGIFKPT
jgi:hypothetical protein